MIDEKELQACTDRLADLLAEKLHLSRGSFERRMRRAGRRLPKRLHQQAAVIVQAQHVAGHPRLAIQTQADDVYRAAREIEQHLKTIDPVDRRKGAILGLLGGLSFNLLALAALVILFLRWRGLA